MANYVDIMIIGGGVSGLLTAALLRENGLNIRIIEQQSYTESTIFEPDLCQRAINLTSQRILESLQIWSNLVVSPYHKMEVWEIGHSTPLKFSADTIRQTVLGHIVSEQQIRRLLREYCQAGETIHWCYAAQPKKWYYEDGNNHLQLVDGTEWIAPLIIGADGERSWLRTQARIAFRGKNYYQRAIVANVTTENPHHQTARQVFLHNGPLAFLPLNDSHQCAIVWSCYNLEAKTLLALSDEAFCRTLAQAFGDSLGNIQAVTQRADFALSQRHAEHYVQSGLALIGDAAHRIHPLAGLGLNLAMADAGCLADTIMDGKTRHIPLGQLAQLRRYERQRRSENSQILWFVDQIKSLFANQSTLTTVARQQGIRLLNYWPFLKRYFIQQATGNLQSFTVTRP